MGRTLKHLDIEIPPPPVEGELDRFWTGAQRRLASALAPRVPQGSKIIYVDFPVHGNTGDQMLLLATDRWLSLGNHEVLGRWHSHNFPFPKIPGDTIIVCQPGGNLGDLYSFQEHREAIVRAYPRNRIVLLPQTIYYRNRERIRRTAEVLRRHGDVHVLVREQNSLAIAESELTGTSAALAPDMSAFLYPLAASLGDPGELPRPHDIVYLIRRDWEWTSGTPVPACRCCTAWPDMLSLLVPGRRRGVSVPVQETDSLCVDWHETAPWQMYQAWAIAGAVIPFGKIWSAAWFYRRWLVLAKEMVSRGARFIAGCRCLVTNRLHAHLMACMLGIPTILLDNSYGKCSAYHRTWLEELGISRFCQQGIVKPDEWFAGIPRSMAGSSAQWTAAHET